MIKSKIKIKNTIHQKFEKEIEKDFKLLNFEQKYLPAFRQGVVEAKHAILMSFCKIYGDEMGAKIFEYFLRNSIQDE